MTATISGRKIGSSQFDIADHYDVMEELDRDVHDDHELSRAEAEAAIRLASSLLEDKVPETVFLPCFGTGRHIPHLLGAGVQRIVGVDLSPRCVAKARALFGSDHRVELHLADLRDWKTEKKFDAGILLGNSFGDVTDPELLGQITAAMCEPVRSRGAFVFDYIGEGFLRRCYLQQPSEWQAVLHGSRVLDVRTPSYNPQTQVMTIDVTCTDQETGEAVWTGAYQKRILDAAEVFGHWVWHGVALVQAGEAPKVVPEYYRRNGHNLGMIGCSNWWSGVKG